MRSGKPLSGQLRSLPAWLVFAVFLGWVAVLAFQDCYYNWDMLAYAAVALEWSGTADVHAATYAAFREQVPEAAMSSLSAPGYAELMASSAEAFASQLAFYTVKPLYVALLVALYTLGVPIVAAIQAVSAASVMLASALVLLWLRRTLTPVPAVLLSIALAYASRLVDLARAGTPDGLSALVTLAGLYLILERRRPLAGALLLLASIAVRTNNVILFAGATAYLALEAPPRLQRRLLAVLVGGTLLCLLIGSFGHGWWALFSHTFVRPLTDAASFSEPFSWPRYADALARAAHELFVRDIAASSGVWFFAALAVLLFQRRPELRSWLGVAALNLAALVLLFPLVANWDRFLVPFYLWIAIALAASLGPHLPAGEADPSQA